MNSARLPRRPRISPEVATTLATYGARTVWPSNFQIYPKGSPADGLSVVLRGHVVLRNRIRSGRGFVPAIVTPGETFGVEGVSSDPVYATDAMAAEETETLYLSGSQFRAFVRENPGPAFEVMGQIMSERTQLLQRLHAMASQNVEQRLVAALQRLSADRSFLASDGRLRLELRHHRLLCEMVGATRESIALALGRLVGTGVAQRRGVAFLISPAGLANHISPTIMDSETSLPMTQETFAP